MGRRLETGERKLSFEIQNLKLASDSSTPDRYIYWKLLF